MNCLISLHLHRMLTFLFLFSIQSTGKKMRALRIIGIKAMAIGPRLSPMSLITGTCVAHIKFMTMINVQSIDF